jgi:hypothetical protein
MVQITQFSLTIWWPSCSLIILQEQQRIVNASIVQLPTCNNIWWTNQSLRLDLKQIRIATPSPQSRSCNLVPNYSRIEKSLKNWSTNYSLILKFKMIAWTKQVLYNRLWWYLQKYQNGYKNPHKGPLFTLSFVDPKYGREISPSAPACSPRATTATRV